MKLWNDCPVCLTDDFYYKFDQNLAMLATLDSLSLSLRSRLNTFNWLIHRNIWQIKYIKTLKIIINYNKYHSIFSIYSTQAKERIRCSTVSPSFANKEFVYNLLFSTYELIDDHRFRERRYIIYTCKLSTYKLNNWLNLS